jgi:predicted component of type VI protein secretion system
LFKGRSFVLILVLLAVLALVGCGSSETKVNADEVVQDALAAQANVDSSNVKIDIVATAEGTLNGEPLDAGLDAALTADIDWANKKMKADLGMNADYNGVSFPISMKMYAVDNCSYTQMTFGMMADNWTKSEFPMDFWLSQDGDQTVDVDSILQCTEAESLPSQKVGGINCYVLQLKPDIAALQEMLSEETASVEEMPDLDSLISDLSIKVWVAKDTSYVTKIEIVLSAHLTGEAMGDPESSDVLDISLTITMEMTDVNEPVSIELPDEAKNAEEGSIELPFDMLG